MKQRIGIHVILFVVLFLLGACSSDLVKEKGGLCPPSDPDRSEKDLSYIVLSTILRCNVNSTDPACVAFRSSFSTKTCPEDYPQCSYFENEYFCGEACPVEFVACAGRCIDPQMDDAFCGAGIDCKDYSACLAGSSCVKGKCIRECAKDEVLCFDECIDPMTSLNYCGATSSSENGCSDYKKCEASQRCVEGQCVTQCAEGQIVCGERCVNAMSDNAFCGADDACENYKICEGADVCANGVCVANCPADQEFCLNGCYKLPTSLENCGACGNTCMKENVASATCVDGLCQEQICYDGYVDCDGKPETGCEIEVRNDLDNCGVCGNVCMNLDHVANVSCSLGQCSILECQNGFADCDLNALNGCETDLTITTGHCGDCKVDCAANNMVGATCENSLCSYEGCPSGYGDCDSKPETGCEAQLNTIENCGVCGRDCLGLLNVVGPACSGTSCIYSRCESGFGDCNGDVSDGCEVNLDAIPNCGTCSEDCSALKNVTATTCSSRKCDYVACQSGYGDCDGIVANGCETNLQITADHCGVCGSKCSSLPNVNEVACSSGGCEIKSCKTGYGNCDGLVANGCEVDFKTTSNCGICGKICLIPDNSQAATCNNGVCGYTSCKTGFGDCDKNVANGCEVDLKTTSNCGTCGTVCSTLANSNGVSCDNGICGYVSCKTGFGDCDKVVANGCEADFTLTSSCGICGKNCAVPANTNAATCSSGVCGYTSCKTGFDDCDKNVANGCEVDLKTPANCGICGKICPLPANTNAASCNAGVCGFTSCKTGFGDCDGLVANGCEVDLKTISNCGTCGTACSTPANSNGAACNAGVCGYTSCKTGFGDCDGNVANGCERDLATISNCGTCGKICAIPANTNAATCENGVCGFTSCKADFGDCDGKVANGCETNFKTPANCGSCGIICPLPANTNAASCNAGVCGFTSCKTGFGDCDGLVANGCEVDLKTIANCGTCGTVCLTPANSNGAACNAGVCGFTSCKTGFGNCDGNVANGCERDLTTTSNCGACGKICTTLPNSDGIACNSGVCGYLTCKADFADCDGKVANGCEADLKAISSCGTCGKVCVAPANTNAATCNGGVCGYTSCKTGFGDCDGIVANGCEVDLKTISNCGTCGTVCSTPPNSNGAACNAGVCGFTSCKTGFGNCDGNVANGCEVNLTTTSNCGTCGKVCTTPANSNGTSCTNGVCGYTSCQTGFGDCDSNVANGCEVNLTTTSNCGTCGKNCSTLSNSNGISCTNGLCAYTSCKAGFADCDGNDANGCEADLTLPSSCGTCTKICPLPANSNAATCNDGDCGFTTCKSGFGNCDGNVTNGCEVDLTSTKTHCGRCGLNCQGSCVNSVCQ